MDTKNKFDDRVNDLEDNSNLNRTLLMMAGKIAKFGGWSVNLTENKVLWSDEVADIHEVPHGFSPDVAKGISFYAPEWRQKIAQVFTNCASQGIPYDEEMEIITAGGNRKWVRTMGQAVINENGKIIKVHGAFQDINEKKKIQSKLTEVQNRYQRLVNNAPDLIYRYEFYPERGFTFVSPSSTHICGYTPDEHYNNPDLGFQLVHPEDQPKLAGIFTNGMQQTVKIDLRWIHKNGNLLWTEHNITPIFDENGLLTAIEGISRDVTSKKLWSLEREHILRLFEEVQSFTKTGAWEYDLNSGKSVLTMQVYEILELDPNNQIKQLSQLKSNFDENQYVILEKSIGECAANGAAFDIELLFYTQNNQSKWIRLFGQKIATSDKEEKIIGGISEITEWKKQHIQLRETKEKYRDLLRTQFQKIEQDRKRLAHEIHDELGQILTVINLDLALFKENTRSQQNLSLIGQTQAALQEAVAIVRRIAQDLRPSLLEQMGLMPAIDSLVRGMAKRMQCTVSVRLPEVNMFEPDQKEVINIYRIVQEALTNIARHAGATHIAVSGSLDDDYLVLTITDNGSGIENQNFTDKATLGIHGMLERAELINAQLKIDTVQNQGTKVTLCVPLLKNKTKNDDIQQNIFTR